MNNEKLFKDSGGNYVLMQSISQNSITVPIKLEKNTKQSVETRIIVGQGLDSASFHTIDMGAIELKKFQMYQLNGDKSLKADQNSFVKGTIEDKMIDLNQFQTWIKRSFQVGQSLDKFIFKDGPNFELKAVSIRDGKAFSISIQNDET